MKITITAIIWLPIFCHTFGAYIKPKTVVTGGSTNTPTTDTDENAFSGENENQRSLRSEASKPYEPPSNNSTTSNPSISPKAAANLIQKVVATLRKKQTPVIDSTKQLFGGRLPPMIERIVQRVQNFFSVYNKPEYFESNGPPVTSNEGIAIICSNGESDSLSCNPVPEEQYQEQCDDTTPENGAAPQQTDELGYNIVVTHTVVQDNMINVYSPVDPSSQVISNVVVILEPSANEYSFPPEPVTNKNKFYVYVNPTAANKKKDQFQTKTNFDSNEKPQPFQPYTNATYTVVIRGDKLEEYSNNIENADNNSLNPELSGYVQNSTNLKLVTNKCKPGLQKECKSQSSDLAEEGALTSRSVPTDNGQNVPNINLVLVPPEERVNKSCTKNKYDTSNIEYYILKPDDGSLSKPKNSSQKITYHLQKTGIDDSISATYLPPEESDSETQPPSTSSPTSAVTELSTNRLPLLFSLFKKKSEEPR